MDENYSIPKKYYDMVDSELLTELRDILFCVFRDTNLGAFKEDKNSLSNVVFSPKWDICFGKACFNQNKEELFDYYRSLGWYEQPMFEHAVSEKMESCVLGSVRKIATKYGFIDGDDFAFCEECLELFRREDTTTISYGDVSETICARCSGKRSDCKSVNQDVRKKIGVVIQGELGIRKEDLCVCKECFGVFRKDMGVLKSKFTCFKCKESEKDSCGTFYDKIYREVRSYVDLHPVLD